MKILLLDTSGPVCGVAIHVDGDLIYEAWMKNKMTHSQKIMPMVDTALQMIDMTLSDIDAFAAVVGPGSFTGVRIGVATAKGLADALDKPCIAVDALEALSRNAGQFEGIVCPILDARAGQIYGAAFRSSHVREQLIQGKAIRLVDFLNEIKQYKGPFLFTGDGIGVYRTAIEAELGDNCFFCAPDHASLRPGCAVQLAAELLTANKSMKADELLPLYLRAPQAERERAAKLAKSGL